MVFGTFADGALRRAGRIGTTFSEAFLEPALRLGVTGLSRSGKTVFITSLVANLLDRGRMPQLRAAADRSILSAYLQPQPDDTVPRFDYEAHLAAMTGAAPHWPEGTRAISELRLSLRLRRGGPLSAISGTRTLHLDIVDYPGEWLLDLGLMDRSYSDWAGSVLARIEGRPEAAAYLQAAREVDPASRHDEAQAKRVAAAYSAYLHAASEAGYADCTPGRFLLPGEMAGSPVLTFAPLPGAGDAPRGSLGREMSRRFEAYKDRVATPFFRNHFARIDRQVVLIDVLGAIHAGPAALEDLRRAMADILTAFRPGQNRFLSTILRGRRVERILFVATKADHLHHTQHAALARITAALVDEARRRADFEGARTEAMAIAALRATTEDTIAHDGRDLPVVRGALRDTGRVAAFYPGRLPDDPARLLTAARDGQEAWLDGDYGVMTFAPAPGTLKPGEGPPHIRLDRAAEFLIGDRL